MPDKKEIDKHLNTNFGFGDIDNQLKSIAKGINLLENPFSKVSQSLNIFKSTNNTNLTNPAIEEAVKIGKTLNSLQPLLTYSRDKFRYSFNKEKECIVCLELNRNKKEPVIEYEGNEDKCIFHCEKKGSFWKKGNVFSGGNSEWNIEALKLFQEKFLEYVKDTKYEDLDFRKAIFPKFALNFSHENHIFEGFGEEEDILEDLPKTTCNKFNLIDLSGKKFIFKEALFLDKFELDTFHAARVEFEHCEFKNNITIYQFSTKEFSFFDCKVNGSLYLKCGSTQKISILTSNVKDKIYIEDISKREDEIDIYISKVRSKELSIKHINSSSSERIPRFSEITIEEPDIENLVDLSHTEVNKVTLKGKQRDISFIINRNKINNLYLNTIDNVENPFKLLNTEINEELNIYNCTLTFSEFRNCDFSKCKLDIRNTSIGGNIIFSNVRWGNLSKERIKTENPQEKREILRQLKKIFDDQKDYIIANKFYSLEMEAYKEELKEKSSNNFLSKIRNFARNFDESLVFNIHSFVSDFGQNWRKPLLLLLASTIIMSTIGLYNSWESILKYMFYGLVCGILLCCILLFLFELYRCKKPIKGNQLLQRLKNKINMVNILNYVFCVLTFYGIIEIFNRKHSETIDYIFEFFILKMFNIYNIDSTSHPVGFKAIYTIYVLVSAFLTYQFIVAVRRKVKR